MHLLDSMLMKTKTEKPGYHRFSQNVIVRGVVSNEHIKGLLGCVFFSYAL